MSFTRARALAAMANRGPRAGADASRLKITSWNIGLRGLERMCSSSDESGAADTHGISRRLGFGSLAGMLRALDADVVCLQEVKVKQLGAPERAIALAEGYDSYFSLCRTQTASTSYGRYAGVATFVRSRCLAHRAEEGVTGALVSLGPTADREGLDGEGRCVVTVIGDLAIVNVYVPAVTSDDPVQAEKRAQFKAAFLVALERRCKDFLYQGLRVLCIGDFNITPAPIDSARELEHSSAAPSPRSWSREWLRAFTKPSAAALEQGAPCFVDAFRALHPTAREAYTCFHVAAGADSFNFGSRIDLALLAPPPLLPSGALSGPAWTRGIAACARDGGGGAGGAARSDGRACTAEIRDGDVDDDEGDDDEGVDDEGDDDEGDDDEGDDCTGRDDGGDDNGDDNGNDNGEGHDDGNGAARVPPAPAPPVRLLACGIDTELQGSDHQPLWLMIDGVSLPAFAPRAPPLASSVRLGGQSTLAGFFKGAPTLSSSSFSSSYTSSSTSAITASAPAPPAPAPPPPPPPSRAAVSAYAPSAPTSRFKQRQLGGFLRASAAAGSGQNEGCVVGNGGGGGVIGGGSGAGGGWGASDGGSSRAAAPLVTAATANTAAMKAAAPSALAAAAAAAAVPSASAAGWHALFSRQEAKIPLCKHGEPCKKQTVRKLGANQGRSFYSCVRAEGPRTNPDANCGYFAWSSDWEQQLRLKRKRDEMASSAGR